MAEIKTFPLFRHLRAEPTSHVLGYKGGALRREGPGQAFWFRAINTAVAEVPIDDREQPFLFHARSADFQELTVQGAITYRVVDPQRVARRIDFAIDLRTGRWTQTPLEQLAGLVTQLAQQFVIDELVKGEVRRILADGVAPIRAHIAAGLAAEPALADLGIELVAVRVAAVAPTRRAGEGAAAADARGDPAARRRGDLPPPRAGRREGAGDRRERAAEPHRARAARGGSRRPGGRQRAQAGHRARGGGDGRGAGRRRAPGAWPPRARRRRSTRSRARSCGSTSGARRSTPRPARGPARARARELAGQLDQIEHLTPHARPAHRSVAGRGWTGRRRVTRCPARAWWSTRPTEYGDLLARHGTREQARFFLAQRGRALADIEERHAHQEVRARVLGGDPARLARARRSQRADLDRFLFAAEDIVVVLGQDGLVANVAKYLDGQPVHRREPGARALPRRAGAPRARGAGDLCADRGRGPRGLRAAHDGARAASTTVRSCSRSTRSSSATAATSRPATGSPSTSATEHQSSSGLIVATGTGATGWAMSIDRERAQPLDLPLPTDPAAGVVRARGVAEPGDRDELTGGLLADGAALEVASELDDDGVVFGDGIETDRLELDWGQRVTIRAADRRLRLVSRSRRVRGERPGTRTPTCSSATTSTAIRAIAMRWSSASSHSPCTSRAATPPPRSATTSSRSHRSAC